MQKQKLTTPLLYWPVLILIAMLASFVAPPLASASERLASDLVRNARPSTNAALPGDAFVYAVGDRLKVIFFERLRSETVRSILSDLVERSELSGEYQVQQDGNLFLPLLGAVSVAGLEPRQLEDALAAAFARQIEGDIKASVQLIEREPVYVTGGVVRPGIFKYVPGMTVLHAITLAGGTEGANTDLWKLLDIGRERERMRKSAERHKQLLARIGVLKAEREGKIAAPPDQLVQRVGRPSAEELVKGEERVRVLERRNLSEQQKAIDALILVTRSELKILQEKMAQVELRIREKAERATSLLTARAHGTVTDTTFYLAQSAVSDARERWHETRASVAQTERKLAELQQERMRTAMESEIARERDLRDAVKAVAEEEVTTAVIGNLLLTTPEGDANRGGTERQFQYTIVRRTRVGVDRLPGTDAVALLPGDLIQVVPIGSQTAQVDPARRPPSTGQNSSPEPRERGAPRYGDPAGSPNPLLESLGTPAKVKSVRIASDRRRLRLYPVGFQPAAADATVELGGWLSRREPRI